MLVKLVKFIFQKKSFCLRMKQVIVLIQDWGDSFSDNLEKIQKLFKEKTIKNWSEIQKNVLN